MKLIFFGTSEFAVPILKAIKEKTDWEIGLVVCEPAKPAGRSNKITDSPIAIEAKKFGIEIYSPESISNSESVETLSKIGADVFVVVAYGQIIPRAVFDIPKFKTVNIHPSLLPRLRGPSPIQTALLNSMNKTGVSLMLIDEKMDSGPVISQETLAIEDADNYQTLENKLSDLAAEILIRDLPKYINGEIKPAPQDENNITITHLIKKEDGHANWGKSADEIYNHWRAFSKWPVLFSFFKGKSGQSVRLKLVEIEKSENSKKSAGEVFTAGKKLFIACGDGAIEVKKLQPENSKTQNAAEFINGYGYVIGQKLF
jgi:methionyl-tRNA formyltransferase